MAQRKFKDFDKEKMYSKIMPTYARRKAEAESEPETDAVLPSLHVQQNDRYLLRNFIEDIVCEKIDRTIEMLRGCDCERCKKDVMALALSEMPTVYEVVEREQAGQLLAQVRTDYEAKVSAALIKAVQSVKTNPNHSREEERSHGG